MSLIACRAQNQVVQRGLIANASSNPSGLVVILSGRQEAVTRLERRTRFRCAESVWRRGVSDARLSDMALDYQAFALDQQQTRERRINSEDRIIFVCRRRTNPARCRHGAEADDVELRCSNVEEMLRGVTIAKL